jgi:pSer/pThr/pTyr-binding forkhead associated (FHA) protein
MQVTLFLLKKDGSTAAFSLPSAVTLVGRRQDCDLSIPLPVISRKHCEINIDLGRLMIRDLHSKNGTLVNGQQVEETQLSPGDQINLGPVTFVVQIDGVPPEIAGITPIETAKASPGNENMSQLEEPFDEFAKDINDAQLGSSHTAEIPDIITDDLSQNA